MVDKLDRRRFMTSAVLGTGAAVLSANALGAVSPEAAFAAGGADAVDKVEPGAPDPNFVEGRITAVNGPLLLVTSSDRSLHRIHVTGSTSVWKLRPTSADQAKVGDGLYARGVRLDDGTLAADSVWLNIVNLAAHVSSMNRNTIHLDHNGDRIVGHVVPGTTAAIYNGTPAVSDLSLLKVGEHVQVIGAWVPDTNQVDIATIFAAA